MHLRTLTLFHLTSFTYAATALLCYPFVGADRWAIVTPVTEYRGLALALIFISGCVLADRVFYRRRHAPAPVAFQPTAVSLAILLAIFVAGFIGFLRFYFDAGAWRYFGTVISAVRSGAEYYDAREAVAGVLVAQTGRGVAHGTTAVYITVPVVIAIGFYFYRRQHRTHYLFLAVAAIIQAILTVFVFVERAPVLYVLTLPFMAWYAATIRLQDPRQFIRRHARLFGAGIAVFTALSLGVYTWTNVGENPLLSLLDRIFLSPCITANYYVAAFPEEFAFRGWSKIAQMGATLGGTDVGTRDIASFVTGGLYSYNPNSGILATAYSGAGLPAGVAITGIYLALVVLVDRCFRNFPLEVRTLNLLVNLYSLPMLSNTPLLAAISSGFAVPSFLLALYFSSCIRRPVPAPAREPALPAASLAAEPSS